MKKNVLFILAFSFAAFGSLIAQNKQVPNATQGVQPRRPENFVPFRYKYTIEQLYEKFSEDLMKRAAEDVKKITAINEKGTYKPTGESLATHPMPEWFEDAKLGIFLDWGPWSVAGYATPRDPKLGTGGSYPDWYEFLMDNAYKAYHDTVWGADFRRDDFLPLLTGSNFDAEEYMDLAIKAGAKYFVPFSRHHGGWTMWESKYTFRNAKEMGPMRNIYKEIADAAKKSNIKLGLYFTVSEWEYPVIVNERVTEWDPTDYLGVFKDKLGLYWNSALENQISGFFPAIADRMSSGKIPVRDYFKDYMMPLFKEAIDNYDPDFVWYDCSGSQPEVTGTPSTSAYFYNQAIGRKDVVINNRGGSALTNSDLQQVNELMRKGEIDKALEIRRTATRIALGDYGTPEYHFTERASEGKKWEVIRSISPAFGYNWTDSEANSLTSEQLIKMFIDIVAGNGNLLLVINPDGSGALSELQKNILLDLGAWLKVNGEGIYGTRPYTIQDEGAVTYTRSKDHQKVYAIATTWPGKQLKLKSVVPEKESKLYMLGVAEPLQWNYNKREGVTTIKIPDNLQDESKRPCQYAYIFSIENTLK